VRAHSFISSHIILVWKEIFFFLIFFLFFFYIKYWLDWLAVKQFVEGRRGRDRMLVGFTTTCTISAYHHWRCEFELRSGNSIGTVRCTKYRTVCMMVNLLDDSNFHRQTAVITRLIEMIIQNPVFGIFCIISMLAHPTSQCLTSFTNIQATITSKKWEICQVLDATKSTWWAFLILFQELNVAMVIKEFNIQILKRPDRTGLKRRKDATSQIILDNLYIGVKRIYASFIKSKIPKIFEVVYR
jgi:hypothetical protein